MKQKVRSWCACCVGCFVRVYTAYKEKMFHKKFQQLSDITCNILKHNMKSTSAANRILYTYYHYDDDVMTYVKEDAFLFFYVLCFYESLLTSFSIRVQ